MSDQPRQRLVRVAGSRRVRLTAVEGTTPEPDAEIDGAEPLFRAFKQGDDVRFNGDIRAKRFRMDAIFGGKFGGKCFRLLAAGDIGQQHVYAVPRKPRADRGAQAPARDHGEEKDRCSRAFRRRYRSSRVLPRRAPSKP